MIGNFRDESLAFFTVTAIVSTLIVRDSHLMNRSKILMTNDTSLNFKPLFTFYHFPNI